MTCLMFLTHNHSVAQFNRIEIKKNNKRIASYRGKKSRFSKEKRYKTIGLSLNSSNYYGDLSPLPQRISTDLSFTRPGVGLVFTNRYGPRYSLKFELLYTTLRGSDSKSANELDLDNGIYRYRRNLSFRNRIKELSVVSVFDLFENQGTYISRAHWTPYTYLGISLFHHNPQAKAPNFDLIGNPLQQAGEWVNLRPLGTEGQNANLLDTDHNVGIKPYSSLQVAIPFGLGARFRFNEVFDFWMDISFRYPHF